MPARGSLIHDAPGGIRALFLSFYVHLAEGFEKRLQQRAAGIFLDTTHHHRLEVHVLRDTCAVFGSAGFGIVGTKHHRADTRVAEGRHTHGTGLQRYGERAVFEIAAAFQGFGEHEHLGVGQRVLRGFHLIVRRSERIALRIEQDGGDGNLSDAYRQLSGCEGALHNFAGRKG